MSDNTSLEKSRNSLQTGDGVDLFSFFVCDRIPVMLTCYQQLAVICSRVNRFSFSRRSLRYICFALVVPVLQAISQTVPTEKWKTFSSSVAGFSVLMPAEPHESLGAPRVDAAYGSLRSYFAEVRSNEGVFAVAEYIFADPIDSKTELSTRFDRFQETAARNLGGKITNQKEVSIRDVPARRVSIVSAIPGLTYTMNEVFAIKGDRLFQLSATSGVRSLPSEDTEKFFDSFNITGPAKEWKRSRSDPDEVVEKDEPEPAQVTTGVTSFECPTYPVAAKKNHIGGNVTIRVTTDGKKITELKSTGVPLLAQAAEENVRTWKFAENAPKTFTVTYRYIQEGEYEPDPIYHCRAKLELPTDVEVSANW